MNLLFVVSHLRGGGLVNVLYNICLQLLQHREINVKILTLRREGERSVIDNFRNLGIEVTQLNLPYWVCELLPKYVCRMVQKIVNNRKINIVHCHGYHPVIVCQHLKKVKKISTLHDRACEDFINVFGKVIGSVMLKKYYHALNRFDLNLAVSKSTAKSYEQSIGNLQYVNNGIDTDKFKPLPKDKKIELREKLGMRKGAKVFVCTGRLEKEKGIEELVRWFDVVKTSQDVQLYVLGGGSLMNECKSIIRHPEKVIFTGQIGNVVDYLQAADYYISNSKSEGMSLAVCEGMACGLYPILSNIPSHHDVGEGVNGCFFDNPKDIDIENVLRHENNPIEYYTCISKYFSVPSMTKSYLEYYHKILY